MISIISWQFAVFVVATVILYYIVPKKYRWIPLLVASIVFYVLESSWKVCFIVFAITQTYVFGLVLKKLSDERKALRRLCLISSIILNVAVLVVFKYLDFFGSSFSKIFSLDYTPLNLVAFIGLSFYTFTLVGYIADVYAKKIEAEKNIFKFSLFVIYFPRIMQGPIGFYEQDADEIYNGKDFDGKKFSEGLFRIVKGLIKKVLIADLLASYTSAAYAGYQDANGTILLLATALYFIQLFMDFSGFIDIMLGISNLFGIDLVENFDQPYLASSVADFWRRWHISLTKWFTRYVYIPLGGSRKGMIRLFVNILIVFLVSGLWHGASWNFVIWGLMHAVCQIIGRLTIKPRNKLLNLVGLNEESKIVIYVRRAITLVIVGFIWVPFFAPSFAATWTIYQKIFAEFSLATFYDGTFANYNLSIQLICIIVGSIVYLAIYKEVIDATKEDFHYQISPYLFAAISFAIMLLVVLATRSDLTYTSDFIYFQF